MVVKSPAAARLPLPTSPRKGEGTGGVRSLRVPFRQQSFDFTCGPTCLLMAMRSFDPQVKVTVDAEIDIWRGANFVEAYASSRQGLAWAAHRRGFRVHTQGSAGSIELLECLGLTLSEPGRGVARALHDNLIRRCRKAGLTDVRRPVSMGDVATWIGRGWVPLLLVDARLVGDEELPHWIVVLGANGENVVFHDPLAEKGRSLQSASRFASFVGFRGISCAVVVEGKRGRTDRENIGRGKERTNRSGS